MRKERVGRGFTLVELLVVIAIIGLLIAMLLPALQSAREAARRTECSNNLKNIGLALQSYHDTYEVFPMGAMHGGGNATNVMPGPVLGPSWWYGLLPFMERRALYDDISAGTQPGRFLDLSSMNSTLAHFNAFNINANLPGRPLDRFAPGYMRCPSSSLPMMENQTGTILMPTYTGIAGGTDIAQDHTFPGPWPYVRRWGIPTTVLVYRNRFYCQTVDNGILTDSGMLPPCKHTSIALCSDGTSNTIIVGEQSDWLRDQDRTLTTKYHGDPGWNLDPLATGNFNADVRGGWLTGTNEFLTVEQRHRNALQAGVTNTVAQWTAHLFNVTTVRYAPDTKDVLGVNGAPGCAEIHEAGRGINNPLQSAHQDGIQGARVDGSVQFTTGSIDLGVMLRLAIRDDGQDVESD